MERTDGKFKNQAGLTLVEIVISIFILSIIVTSFSGALVYATRVTKDNRIKTAAINLANEEIEKIRSMKFVDIGNKYGDPPGNIPTEREVMVDGITYKINTLINWEEQGEWTATGNMEWDYKSVRVTVAPKDMDSNPNLTKLIETYVTRDSTQPALTGGNLRAGLVRGWNLDPSKEIPVSGVKVSLYKGAAASRIVYTTSEGVARFVDLSDGNYKVTVDPSSKGMIVNPSQVSGWEMSIAGTTTLTELFEVEYPCNLNFIMKEIGGSPIDLNSNTEGVITLQIPYGDSIVKTFKGSDVDSEGKLPQAFIRDLWPVGDGYSGQYKIPEVEIPEFFYLGGYEKNGNNETEWMGTFDGPGTQKDIFCYFYPFPDTPSDANIEWVTIDKRKTTIETGSHESSNGLGDIIPTSVSAYNQEDTLYMPSNGSADITASSIYFDNTGSYGNPGVFINKRSNLVLRSGMVIFRGKVNFDYDSNSNYIGVITLKAEYDKDSPDHVINGSEIGGIPGESYGKLFLAEPMVLNNQSIIEKGIYYYRDGIEIPGAVVNNTDLIPVTKGNYVE
ncbi:MAG: prepilin-type N-terminal cleavage/methylation domain-containing protein [Anaerocolumna sp.]